MTVLPVLAAALFLATGCGKKRPLDLPAPSPRSGEAAVAAPVVTLTVTPERIQSGQSATLSWEAHHADTLVIDGGIGTVGLAGSRSLAPRVTTSYTARASGAGGSSTATATITVTGDRAPASGRDAAAAGADVDVEALFNQNVRDIFFEYDRFELSPEAIDILYANASFLRQQPAIQIIIEGHCDERGTAEYNLALGDRRAKVTKDFLVSIGIAADRITTISYGEERPFDSGHTEDGWVKNRRAHFALARP